MSEIETRYKLYRGIKLILSGNRDTINLYLRMCLDKWEDALTSDKRKAMFFVTDRDARKIRSLIAQDKDRAYEAWRKEMIDGEWKVKWTTEDGVYIFEDGDKFFLEGEKE